MSGDSITGPFGRRRVKPGYGTTTRVLEVRRRGGWLTRGTKRSVGLDSVSAIPNMHTQFADWVDDALICGAGSTGRSRHDSGHRRGSEIRGSHVGIVFRIPGCTSRRSPPGGHRGSRAWVQAYSAGEGLRQAREQDRFVAGLLGRQLQPVRLLREGGVLNWAARSEPVGFPVVCRSRSRDR